jgi:thioredoxin-dependent peroxiredoxin
MRLAALLAPLALLAAPALANLPVGAPAPDFTTRGAVAGQVVPVHLADLLKKGPVVLYFFPAAYTGGCNAEAHAFAEQIEDFRKAGATVLGMSGDDVPTLVKFSSEKCAGKFTVASAGPRVMQGYDVTRPGGPVTLPDGRTLTMSSRTSYVIAPSGKVVYAFSEADPTHHIENTLAAVRKLTGRS